MKYSFAKIIITILFLLFFVFPKTSYAAEACSSLGAYKCENTFAYECQNVNGNLEWKVLGNCSNAACSDSGASCMPSCAGNFTFTGEQCNQLPNGQFLGRCCIPTNVTPGQACTTLVNCPPGYYCSRPNPQIPGQCVPSATSAPGDPIVDGVFLFDIDPLRESGLSKMTQFQTPAGVLNAMIPYLFTFAGLILFVMLLWGGFEMMTGAASTKAQEAGKQRITAALIGFTLLFVSYWLARIIQEIFGLSIL